MTLGAGGGGGGPTSHRGPGGDSEAAALWLIGSCSSFLSRQAPRAGHPGAGVSWTAAGPHTGRGPRTGCVSCRAAQGGGGGGGDWRRQRPAPPPRAALLWPCGWQAVPWAGGSVSCPGEQGRGEPGSRCRELPANHPQTRRRPANREHRATSRRSAGQDGDRGGGTV